MVSSRNTHSRAAVRRFPNCRGFSVGKQRLNPAGFPSGSALHGPVDGPSPEYAALRSEQTGPGQSAAAPAEREFFRMLGSYYLQMPDGQGPSPRSVGEAERRDMDSGSDKGDNTASVAAVGGRRKRKKRLQQHKAVAAVFLHTKRSHRPVNTQSMAVTRLSRSPGLRLVNIPRSLLRAEAPMTGFRLREGISAHTVAVPFGIRTRFTILHRVRTIPAALKLFYSILL